MTSYHILLAGNPNVGKSTIFNALTGLKQHTGNWSGKTVELASGSFCLNDFQFRLTDLPGTYSIISNSPEEEIARDAICFDSADMTLVVADATCLARNLNLLLQILEITPKVVLCINLLDEAERRGILVDLDALKRQLNIPVIGISARKRKDIKRLKGFLADLIQQDFSAKQHPVSVTYSAEIEAAVTRLSSFLPPSDFSSRFLSLKALDNAVMATKLLAAMPLSDADRITYLSAAREAKDDLISRGISPVHLRDSIVGSIIDASNQILEKSTYLKTDCSLPGKWDRILTSRRFGIPIMLGFLGILLWITVWGANYPSQFLLEFFQSLTPHLACLLNLLQLPAALVSLLVDGVYHTTAWVTAVMLPPMAIFFPLFTLLEDLGVLPRLAFNLDRCFRSAGSCGKQALTMCMGLGCNAVGVTGCRIFSSRRERFAAMITNCFIPCNGRFSMLITLSSLFIGSTFCQGWQAPIAALFILVLILIGVLVTLGITKIITSCFFPDEESSFSLELPPFRKPQVMKTIVISLFDRTLKILGRAIRVSAPAGALIWMMANLNINHTSLLHLCASWFEPFASMMGIDGMILLAFFLALPANEIVLPIILMGYLSTGQMADLGDITAVGEILVSNGWTVVTAINVMLFSLLHFPCGTTLWTIRKESGSTLWMVLGFVIPTVCAILVCIIVNSIFLLFV